MVLSVSVGVKVKSMTAKKSDAGTWKQKMAGSGREIDPLLSLVAGHDEVVSVGFNYFGGADANDMVQRNVPVRRIALADGSTW